MTLFVCWSILYCISLYSCPHFWVFPSTRRLAADLLREIVRGRVTFEGDVFSGGDWSLLRGADIREMTINVDCGSGSDDEMEIGIVQFQFRPVGESVWRKGVMAVWTDFDSFGRRYIIEASFWHDGP
jgi:hypothetical protein